MLNYEKNDLYTPLSVMFAEMSRVKRIAEMTMSNNNVMSIGALCNMKECLGSLRSHIEHVGIILDTTTRELDHAFYERNVATMLSRYGEFVSDIKKTLTIDELFRCVAEYRDGGTWIELGVRDGDGIMRMLRAGAKYVHGADSWVEDGVIGRNDIERTQAELNEIRNRCFTRFSRNSRVTLHEGYTFDVVKTFDDELFDLVYIDADHTYDGISQDIRDWWPKVMTGGVLAGHDYIDIVINRGVRFGVIQALDDFIKENAITSFHITADSPGSWAIVKEPS